MSSRNVIRHIAAAAALVFLCSCAKENVVPESTYTVAVVLPMDSSSGFDVDAVIGMFEDNLEYAQKACSHRVKLNIEKYDEATADVRQLASSFAGRSDLKAVIGPYDQSNLKIMADRLKLSETKVLMAVNAASTEVVRGSVERGDYFWALTQTDISKCEIILSTAAQMGVRQFDLICGTGQGSQTYRDWLPFEATELGVAVSENHTYADTTDIRASLDRCFDSANLDKEAIVCVPDNEVEAAVMLDELDRKVSQIPDGRRPKIFFSDNVSHMKAFYDYFGDVTFYTVSPSCSPSSGFFEGYKSSTGNNMVSVESEIYDALMLVSMALARDPEKINQSMIDLTSTDTDGGSVTAWTPECMAKVFEAIDDGKFASHIAGASGPLVFDKDNHTCVTQSYYMLYHYQFATLFAVAYYSADKADHTASAVADWKWQSTQLQDFSGVIYKPGNKIPLDKRWAVVVAASEGFDNYRHQADALNVYQYLRSAGYDDDHILLIMADDIADNAANSMRGQVLGPDGDNLYKDVHVDFKLKDLSPQQVLDKIAELPCDYDDNVMVFWSGHGEPGVLMWGQDRITASMVKDTQERMDGRYRKMAWFIEACYGGGIGKALEGHDHLIVLTAANENETSKAYLKNMDLGVWISNRFSAFLLSKVKDNPNISFRDLYYYLSMQTIGSHATLYNYANYGDITEETLSDYFM